MAGENGTGPDTPPKRRRRARASKVSVQPTVEPRVTGEVLAEAGVPSDGDVPVQAAGVVTELPPEETEPTPDTRPEPRRSPMLSPEEDDGAPEQQAEQAPVESSPRFIIVEPEWNAKSCYSDWGMDDWRVELSGGKTIWDKLQIGAMAAIAFALLFFAFIAFMATQTGDTGVPPVPPSVEVGMSV